MYPDYTSNGLFYSPHPHLQQQERGINKVLVVTAGYILHPTVIGCNFFFPEAPNKVK